MFRKLLLSLFGLLGLVGVAQAQQAIQYSPQHLDAASGVASASAAVNTALTLTIPAVSGQFAYVTQITLEECNDATGAVNANNGVSSTNLNGWLTQIGVIATASACMTPVTYIFPQGLKSAAAGTVTTIVVAQPALHTGASGSVSFYYGF